MVGREPWRRGAFDCAGVEAMTAIGFACLLVAFLASWLNDVIDLPEWCLPIVGLTFLIGAVSLISGVTVWLWRVMP